MNLYKKYQLLYTESLVSRSDIKHKNLKDALELTTEGQMYLVTQPVLEAVKDARDTVKPYKTNRQVSRDAVQFFNGIYHAATGLMMLLIVPIMFVFSFVDAISKPRTLLPSLFKALVLTPFEATILLVRGASQIVTAPLTLLRMPLRALITYFSGVPKIENNAGIKALVADAKKMQDAHMNSNSCALINYMIRKKCVKAYNNGQTSAIPAVADELLKMKTSPDENGIKIYWEMFVPRPVKAKPVITTATNEETTTLNQEGDESVNSKAAPDSPSRNSI